MGTKTALLSQRRVVKETGGVLNGTGISIQDASDSEFAAATAESGVLFWFKMPATGRVKATVWLLRRYLRFSGVLRDEYGTSELQGIGRVYAYANIVNPVLDEMGGKKELYSIGVVDNGGADELTWMHDPSDPPGYELLPVFISDQVYPAGSLVLLECGTSQLHHFWVNDFTCNSTIYND